ncbi:hypothetical protein [Streptomyces sp. MMG1533]|nr:hypothetical protein [Streptomyces sp. MMG1533]
MKTFIQSLKDRYRHHGRPHLTRERVHMAGETLRWIAWLVEQRPWT